jgi:hypothetical protein
MFYGADYTRHAGRAALSVRPGFETMRPLLVILAVFFVS